MRLLILLGAAVLLIYLVEKIYEKFWFRNLKIDVQFQEQSAVEGEKACLTETVENRKWLPVPMLQVEFLVDNGLGLGQEENASKSDKQYKRDVFSVSFFQRISRKITFDCLKRGYYEIHQANLTTRGLRMDHTLYQDVDLNTFLYVYPKKLPRLRTELPLHRLGGILERRKGIIEDPFAFAGIREYDSTDPMNRINWKASARSGDLMVNIQNSTYSAKAVCFLDVEDMTLWKHDEVHEEGIRLAATLLGDLLKKSVPVALYSNGYDCLNQVEIKVPIGSGRGQAEKVNRSLSRLDLKTKQKVRPIVEVLEAQKKELFAEQPVVVLISENHSEQLLHTTLELQRNGVSVLWIGTYYKEDFWDGSGASRITFIQWEVKHEG